jgi:hypothetical protein
MPWMGSLIEELKRREAAARVEAERLRSRIEELAEELARAEEQVSRLVITREEVVRVMEAYCAVPPDDPFAVSRGMLGALAAELAGPAAAGLLYAMYLNSTVAVPDVINKASPIRPGLPITVPADFTSLLPPGKGAPRESLETQQLLSFAAIDPPAGPAKVTVIAIGGGPNYATGR